MRPAVGFQTPSKPTSYSGRSAEYCQTRAINIIKADLANLPVSKYRFDVLTESSTRCNVSKANVLLGGFGVGQAED